MTKKNIGVLKLASLIIFSHLILSNATSQTADRKFSIGLNIGTRKYNGDMGNGLSNFKKIQPMVGLQLGLYLSKTFDLNLGANSGNLNYLNTDKVPNFESSMIDGALMVKLKTYNGGIFKEDALLAPYLLAGIGFAASTDISPNFANKYNFTYAKKANSISLPIGMGFRVRLSEVVNINLQAVYNLTASDDLDALKEIKARNDKYMNYSIGLVFNLGKAKPKDDDKDGVINKLDKCPTTKAGYKVDMLGCDLDSDRDGVVDSEDKCPAIKGLKLFTGCPDTDNDGVVDSEDKCPAVAGLSTFNGCPDSDKDGVQDSEDNCPTLAGLEAFDGCPDSDKDGVIDKDDKCPTIAGTATNKGCPEIKEEVKQQIALAAKGIFFESGKDIIKKESIDDLMILIKILQENTAANCDIEGHTDNAGVAEKNTVLSQKRADAVKSFLVTNGVSESRLAAKGFGADKPIADNKTKNGKAKNRRVEFKVGF